MMRSERPSQSLEAARFSARVRQIAQLSGARALGAPCGKSAEAPRHPPKPTRDLDRPLGLDLFRIFLKPIRALRNLIALRDRISGRGPSRIIMGSGL